MTARFVVGFSPENDGRARLRSEGSDTQLKGRLPLVQIRSVLPDPNPIRASDFQRELVTDCEGKRNLFKNGQAQK